MTASEESSHVINSLISKMVNNYKMRKLLETIKYIWTFPELFGSWIEEHRKLAQLQGEELRQIKMLMCGNRLHEDDISKLTSHFGRNVLPNNDAALQKLLVATWCAEKHKQIGYKELLESGFRVYSQNDEDGILLRIFAQIGHTNKWVIEIGSNCNGSDIGIPENLSTNLIVNHGWSGLIFEIDAIECQKMQYFFARNLATKHFHWADQGMNKYYSPRIFQGEINNDNINAVIKDALEEKEPDLLIIDIDGGDYEVIQAMTIVNPRVLVVEFEKRFRDTFSVIQSENNSYGKSWTQSGAASLPAWIGLLSERGYILVAINLSGFNAFFVRSDVAGDRLLPLSALEAFDEHPVFSKMKGDFWIAPDATWQNV